MFEKLRKLFDTPEWHNQPEVIDVTDTEPSAIASRPVASSSRGQTKIVTYVSDDTAKRSVTRVASDKVRIEEPSGRRNVEDDMRPDSPPEDDPRGWLLLLGGSHVEQYGSSRQAYEEATKLFVKVADYIDGRLQAEGRSLRGFLNEFRANYYYRNPMQDMYDVAYDFIRSHYSGDHRNSRSYLYANLSEEVGDDIVRDVYALCARYIMKLPAADEGTIRAYNLMSNGLPYRWWDTAGALRQSGELSEVDRSILDNSPSRSTTFWSIHPSVNRRVIDRYLEAMNIVTASLDDEQYGWSTKQRRVLERMRGGTQEYWADYDELRLPAALLKLAEQSIRLAVLYARPLTVTDEEITIQRLVPKELRDELLAVFSRPIVKSLGVAAVDALRDSYSQSWKIDAERVTTQKHLSQFVYYYDSDKSEKFMNEVFKRQIGDDVSLLVLYYLSRNQPLSAAKQKRLNAYIHHAQQQAFKALVDQNKTPTASLIAELRTLAEPPRRTVTIDSTRVEQVKQRHAETVSKLNEYLGEGDEVGGTVAEAPQPLAVVVAPKQTVADMFAATDSEMVMEHYEVAFIQLLLSEESGLSLSEAKQFAASHKRMLASMVQSLNQKAYLAIEDQFIIQSDDILIIESHYIEFARKSISP